MECVNVSKLVGKSEKGTTMKIVHVITGLGVGGAELMLKRLVIHSIQKQQFEHIVISLTDLGVIGPELQNEGIKVYSLGMKNALSTPIILIRLRKLLKVIKPNIVQTWMYHADFIGGIVAKSIGIRKIIWGIRTTDVSQAKSNITVYLSKICAKLSYTIPDYIICAANVSRDYHVNLGYNRSKMIVIPNGFELDELLISEAYNLEIRNEINLSIDDITIGSIGRFNLDKNQRLFIVTASILIKKFPKLKFLIVGKDNTKDNVELMSWINEYGLSDSFRLLGLRDDVTKCLNAIDIFCLHSKTEGFPNVLGEAMAIGLPCVSTDVGDAAYIMGDLGKLVPTNNADELAKAIENIIHTTLRDIEALDKLKLESRQRIQKNFSMEKVYREYVNTWCR